MIIWFKYVGAEWTRELQKYRIPLKYGKSMIIAEKKQTCGGCEKFLRKNNKATEFTCDYYDNICVCRHCAVGLNGELKEYRDELNYLYWRLGQSMNFDISRIIIIALLNIAKFKSFQWPNWDESESESE